MKISAVFAAALAVGISAVSAQAANTTSVTLTITASGGTWNAFASVSDPTNDQTQGLAGIEFSVVGTGGLTVTSSTNKLPKLGLTDPDGEFNAGFNLIRNNGAAGLLIKGTQGTTNYQIDEDGFTNILLGVGQTAGSYNGATWAAQVLLASGAYSGSVGTLTVSSDPASVTLLPFVLPTPDLGGTGGITTFSPAAVVPGTVVLLASVPEPASLGLLGLGALALIARRRKVA